MDNPFSHLSDEQLMLRYQEGENMAFDILYSRHKDKIYTYLTKRVHDRNEVDDLFQRSIMKFHKSRSLYKKNYSVLAWMYTITKSEFLDYLKRPKRSFEAIDENLSLSTDIENEFEEINLKNEKSLSENERMAIEERYFSEKEFIEIAERLKTSEPNIRKLISRGIKKLRVKYNGDHS